MGCAFRCLTGSQAADSPRFVPVLDKVKARGPVGRPRTRPDAVVGGKAYSSRTNLRGALTWLRGLRPTT